MNSSSTIVVKAIQRRIDAPESGLRKVAREVGLSAPYLHDIVHGRRGVSIKVAGLFGFEWKDGKWQRVAAK